MSGTAGSGNAAPRPRVVDFSSHISGPVATRHLAQLGADVIKVERPGAGDGNRLLHPLVDGVGAGHLFMNAGARSIAVHHSSPEWPRIVEAAVHWADVVIVSSRPESAARIGLGFEALARINPRLVYCAITGYGLAGPWAARPGHGLNIDAQAGVVPLSWEGGRPWVPDAYRTVGTATAGVQAALGIFAALYRRSESAQFVNVSLWESALGWMWRDLAAHANGAGSWPSYNELGARYCLYRTRDGKALLVCPVERKYWERFCDIVELPAEARQRGDWTGGMDFGARYLALGEREMIEERIARRNLDEWCALFDAADIPATPVEGWEQAYRSEHARLNGAMVGVSYKGRDYSIPTVPVSVTAVDSADVPSIASLAEAHASKGAMLSDPPELGQHSQDILALWGVALPPGEGPNAR